MTLPHIALVLLISAIWGFTFVASKVGLDHFTPLFFTGLRFLLVALLLSPFLKPVKGSMKEIFWIAVSVGILHFTFMYLGINAAGGVTAVAIASQLIAPFSLILAIIFLKETIGWRRIVGIIMAFGGVMVLGFDPVIFD
jgi:O-acetylserine/cysteine efflux transporter